MNFDKVDFLRGEIAKGRFAKLGMISQLIIGEEKIFDSS
jgi:hypothetical protein